MLIDYRNNSSPKYCRLWLWYAQTRLDSCEKNVNVGGNSNRCRTGGYGGKFACGVYRCYAIVVGAPFLLAASTGTTTASKVSMAPTNNKAAGGLRVTPVTGRTSSRGSLVQAAVKSAAAAM